ncbi:MAG: NACHT domain-containing protein, partial [Candidatus Electrothrix sp. EH2]|nr:NACHT domain-containing protein [Candidatus Electrothrix sp. EH2]
MTIIRQSLDDSDFGLALLSEAFFASKYITEVELKHLLENDKLLPVGLNSKVQGKDATTGQFRRHVLKQYSGEQITQLYDRQIFYLTDRKGDFFADCDEEGQEKFIRELYAQIQQRAAQLEQEKKQAQALSKKELCCQLDTGRRADYRCEDFIAPTGKRDRIDTAGERCAKEQAPEEETTRSYEALEDMFDWLNNSDSGLYALLGDYGMGKTFTCRMFARQLADQCQNHADLPKPIYIDLRDVPTFITVNTVTRQPTLEEMLTTVLRFSGQEEAYSADELIKAAQQGKQLLIFDGLDEKLVYYTADMRSQFLSELLRVFPQSDQARVKIVISCRTHHFETISQMNHFLLGLNRSGLRSEDYRVLHLLPFSSSQILQLLTKLLGTQDANSVFSFIDSEDYLKDLAQRPFILKQLSRTLPELQELKNRGIPVNAASFYQALIKDNISRDDEKHIR